MSEAKIWFAVSLACFGIAGCGGEEGVGEGTGRQFAGALTGSDAFLAVVGNDTKMNAYLCDGNISSVTTAEWFRGDVSDGVFTASSDSGATISGSYGDGRVTGMLTIAGAAAQAFDLPATPGMAGLYRGSLAQAGKTFEAGVIVDAGGAQRGAINVRGTTSIMPTPMLTDLTSVSTSIEGTSVTIPLNEALNAYLR
jgi:hypothetical protein